RDYNCERCSANKRVAVLEFARVIHVNRNVCQFLNHVLASHTRMAAGSGSNNADAPQIPQLLGTDADLVELHDALFQRNARLDGVAQTLRLVEDFLNHVMRKSRKSTRLNSSHE